MKKQALVIFFLLFISISLISAIDLDVRERPIVTSAIIELNEPAVFNLQITNNGEGDNFKIYSLVGVRLEPTEEFFIDSGETKNITLRIYPRDNPEFFSFQYKIKDSQGDIQEEDLAISIINLKDAFEVYVDNIGLDSKKTTLTIENKVDHAFFGINAEVESIFFEKELELDLKGKEKEEVQLDINQEILNRTAAGTYILTARLNIRGEEAIISSTFRFNEMSNIDTTESREGLFTQRIEIEKTNLGNVATNVEIVITKNWFSRIFTGFNMPYTRSERRGLTFNYIFQKNLSPKDSLRVIAKTNWWILILIILLLVLIFYFLRQHIVSKLIIRKKVSFVKTKGGEFALKVTIFLKSKAFIENVKVVDKLPGMVKLYDRYGTIAPNKVDQKNRKLEWDIENLDTGEERLFSYVIYSKIGVVGKFEMPEARAVFDYQGKSLSASSNKAFFLNEPDKEKSPGLKKF